MYTDDLVKKARSQPPSFQDDAKNRLILVNYQTDFLAPDRDLKEEDAEKVVEGTVKLVEDHFDKWTQVVPTMLNHFCHQIFFPTMWVNSEGLHPKVGTVITAEDFESEKWMLRDPASWCGMDNDATIIQMVKENLKVLEEIRIRPNHCLSGTIGQTLVKEINEVRFKHCFARRYAPEVEMYNHHPLVYSPSVFGSKLGNTVNKRFLTESNGARRVFFAGIHNVAKSAVDLAKFHEASTKQYEDVPEINAPELDIFIVRDLCTEAIPENFDCDIRVVDSGQISSLLSI